jgi:hypothetical protein
MKQLRLLFLPAAALCLLACGGEDYYTASPTYAEPFYGADYAGRYQSLQVFSNGNDVSDFVQVKLHLRANTYEPSFALDISEQNPATGTSRLESWSGTWNTSPDFDSLFLQRQVGETIVYDSTGSQVVPIYQMDTLLVRKVSPGIWSMRWHYKSADQDYHLERL